MNVKELIEQLSKFDPETEVICSCTDPTDYTYKVPIKSIELDHPWDSNGFSGVDGSEIVNDDYDDNFPWDKEGNYVGSNKVVVIDLGDV